jgi:uncharacterized RDD family membrane protein YckC
MATTTRTRRAAPPNPYAAPTHGPRAAIGTGSTGGAAWAPVGFWKRAVAYTMDQLILNILTSVIALLLAFALTTTDELFAAIVQFAVAVSLSMLYVIGAWKLYGATPGKLVFSAVIRRADTLGKPSTGQLIGRYFAYILSALPLGVGFIWAAFDARKRTWHDLLCGTVVVRRVRRAPVATRGIRRAPRPAPAPTEA